MQEWGIRIPGFGVDAHDREVVEGEKEGLNDTEKTRLHIARMQKVRDAIRAAGRGKHGGGIKKKAGKSRSKEKM